MYIPEAVAVEPNFRNAACQLGIENKDEASRSPGPTNNALPSLLPNQHGGFLPLNLFRMQMRDRHLLFNNRT